MLCLRQHKNDTIYIVDQETGETILKIKTLKFTSLTSHKKGPSVELGFEAEKRYKIYRGNAGNKT